MSDKLGYNNLPVAYCLAISLRLVSRSAVDIDNLEIYYSVIRSCPENTVAIIHAVTTSVKRVFSYRLGLKIKRNTKYMSMHDI